MFRKLYQSSRILKQQMVILSFTRQFAFRINSFRGTRTFLVPPKQPIQFRQKSLKKNQENIIDAETELKIKELEEILRCSYEEAFQVYRRLSSQFTTTINLKEFERNSQWLSKSGATFPVILKNSHILLSPLDRLKERHELLSRSKWKQTDDFVALLAVNESKIRHMQLTYTRHVFRNRIYFLHEKFRIEPHIICYHCSKHLFMFEIELNLLQRKLELFRDFNVVPENILRDLHVLARAEDVIKDKLEYLRSCGIENVKPWMIKCEDHRLNRLIEIRNWRAKIQNEVLDMLSERLDWHGKTAQSKFMKNKFLLELSYETANELLDEYLKILPPDEITNNIQLLSLPISEVKTRVAELTSLDTNEISPNVFKMSKIKFKQFLDVNKNE